MIHKILFFALLVVSSHSSSAIAHSLDYGLLLDIKNKLEKSEKIPADEIAYINKSLKAVNPTLVGTDPANNLQKLFDHLGYFPCDLRLEKNLPKVTFIGGEHHTNGIPNPKWSAERKKNVKGAAEGRFILALERYIYGDPGNPAYFKTDFRLRAKDAVGNIKGVEESFSFNFSATFLRSIKSWESYLRERTPGDARLSAVYSFVSVFAQYLKHYPESKEIWDAVKIPLGEPKVEQVAKLIDELSRIKGRDAELALIRKYRSIMTDWKTARKLLKEIQLAAIRLAEGKYKIEKRVPDLKAAKEFAEKASTDFPLSDHLKWNTLVLSFLEQYANKWRSKHFATSLANLYCELREKGLDIKAMWGNRHNGPAVEDFRGIIKRSNYPIETETVLFN